MVGIVAACVVACPTSACRVFQKASLMRSCEAKFGAVSRRRVGGGGGGIRAAVITICHGPRLDLAGLRIGIWLAG